MTVVKCETVTVSVVDQSGDGRVVTLPAYTVSPNLLLGRVGKLTVSYLAMTEAAGNEPSLADFVLFLAAQAAQDPHEQEVDG